MLRRLRRDRNAVRDRSLHVFRQRLRDDPLATHTTAPCPDLQSHPVRDVDHPASCQDHTAADGPEVQLRVCLTCGYVGCCDSSAGRHATKHALLTGHPVIQTAEQGESWRWCYVHEILG